MRIDNHLLPGVIASPQPETNQTPSAAMPIALNNTALLPNIFLNSVLKNGLTELTAAIFQREQLLSALPEKLQLMVTKLISQEYQTELIKDAGFSVLAAAAKTINKELRQLLILLKTNSDALPLEIKNEWVKMAPHLKEKVISSLQELISSYAKTEKSQDILKQSTSNISFFLPLQFAEKSHPYPAYIHIYQDREEERPGSAKTARELWLRVCLVTENMGLVETVFYLTKQSLDIRLSGSESAIAHLNAGDIRLKLGEMPLQLGNIVIKPSGGVVNDASE